MSCHCIGPPGDCPCARRARGLPNWTPGSYQFTPFAPIPTAPVPEDFDGCRPLKPLTEEDVRRIIREELERLAPKATGDT